MTSAVPVIKMHGALNDFVLIDERERSRLGDYPAFAQLVCERHSGIGADGVLVVLPPSERADARMRIFNADGSEAEMCGNGIRCVARYLFECGEGDEFAIETLAGPILAEVVARTPRFLVRVDMGTPSFDAADVGVIGRAGSALDCALDLSEGVVRFSGVSMGNPHAVVFVEKLAGFDLAHFGKSVGEHPAFRTHVNAHAVERVDRSTLIVQHWERGAGATQACGTGAVACAAAAIARGAADSPVAVHVPGGTLSIEWDGRGHAFMTGEAARVFATEIALSDTLTLGAR